MKRLIAGLGLIAALAVPALTPAPASAHTYYVADYSNCTYRVYGHCYSPCRTLAHGWIDTIPMSYSICYN